MTMLFNLNWRNNGGLVMGEPTLSHITSQLRTQSGEPLGDVGSFGTKQNETAIHLGSRTVDEIDEVSLLYRKRGTFVRSDGPTGL